MLRVRAEAATTAPTGVEMEALTAASVAALTVYDMVKGVERASRSALVRLVSKTGGKSGDWHRPADDGRRRRPPGGRSRATVSPAGSGPKKRVRDERPVRARADGQRRRAAGEREDESGAGVARRLEELGFASSARSSPTTGRRSRARSRPAPPHHPPRRHDRRHRALTPRDVTPQATLAVIDYEVPGLAEAMRAAGRRSTPMADLSRAVVGVRGRTPDREPAGQPRGALESLEAIVPVLDHALETLAGRSTTPPGRIELPPAPARSPTRAPSSSPTSTNSA